MSDPFEVRIRFTSLLHHLNASTSSATKAASYAVKHAEYADDLHSCILEQLERNNLNNRANIMYFLPSLCEAAEAQGLLSYVRMVERDVLQIVDSVAPEDETGGAANVKVVRTVLHQLQQKGFLQKQTVVELEECIASRDRVHLPPSPVHQPPRPPAPAHYATPRSESRHPSFATPTPAISTAGLRLDRKQIEQRIEEDRERHKRAREGIWAIGQATGAVAVAEDAEQERFWAKGVLAGADEWRLADEEMIDRERCLGYEEAVAAGG